MYRGAEVAEYTCGYFASSWSPLLFIAPEEYLSYGIGGVHNLTTKPIDPNTSRKEYKITDHLGNTRVVLEQSGAIAGQYDYEPFGGVLWQSAPTPRLSFIDKEKDAETGLSEFGVRKYDDGLGRFTSVDADWELYRDLTPYNYAENNPLVLKDPSGYGPGDREDYQDKNLPMRHIGGGSGGPRTAPSVGYNSTAKPSAPKAPKSQTSSGSKRGSGGNSGVGGGTTPLDNQGVSMTSERLPMQQAKGADVTPKTSNAAESVRTFEASPKHGNTNRGRANKAPTNPQESLDNSYELPGNTTRRVGVDKSVGEFNVFDEHTSGKFHGHSRKWNALSQDMKNVLIKNGVVNQKGKILE